MKLHLGCGEFYKEGYINMDINSKDVSKVDRIFDCNLPLDYKDNSVEEILAIHVFEHLKRKGLNHVVKSWHRVLQPGGKIILELPNMLIICHQYLDRVLNGTEEEVEEILKWIYGNQERKGQLHFWGWSPPTLERFMKKFEFKKVQVLPSIDDTRPFELCFRLEATK